MNESTEQADLLDGTEYALDDWRGYEHYSCKRCRWDGLGREAFLAHWQETHTLPPRPLPVAPDELPISVEGGNDAANSTDADHAADRQ